VRANSIELQTATYGTYSSTFACMTTYGTFTNTFACHISVYLYRQACVYVIHQCMSTFMHTWVSYISVFIPSCMRSLSYISVFIPLCKRVCHTSLYEHLHAYVGVIYQCIYTFMHAFVVIYQCIYTFMHAFVVIYQCIYTFVQACMSYMSV
jgi:hypothetical protein